MKIKVFFITALFLLFMDNPMFTSTSAAENYFSLGMSSLRAEDYTREINNFIMATFQDRDYKEAYFQLGYARYKKGSLTKNIDSELEGAVKDFNKFFEFEPRNEKAYYYIRVI